MTCKFLQMLERRWDVGARVCIGLDSDRKKIPAHLRPAGLDPYGEVTYFNEEIVNATKNLALAYKPNIAFYSGVYGERSRHVLRKTIGHIRDTAPDVPIILDAKRADIGNTNLGYVEEAFEEFDADAETVQNYFGMEAMKPFLDQKDKGIIVLCRTSNPGAGEFQDLPVSLGDGHVTRPLYQVVANQVATKWNYNGNCSLVVGATYPEELREVRKIIGNDMWLLLPGIGTQGGDVSKAVRNGINKRGRGIIINSASGIIFASGGMDFAEAARNAAQKLTTEIDGALAAAL